MQQEVIQQEGFVFHLHVVSAGAGISIIAIYLDYKMELSKNFKIAGIVEWLQLVTGDSLW
jgi:hypothetical protein